MKRVEHIDTVIYYSNNYQGEIGTRNICLLHRHHHHEVEEEEKSSIYYHYCYFPCV